MKRIFKFFKNKFLNFKFIFRLIFNFNKNKNQKIIFVSHDFEKAGAQKLLYNIIVEFNKRNYDIIVITKKNGPFYKEFSKFSNIYILGNKKILSKLLNLLLYFDYKKVILNTVVTGDLIVEFKNKGFFILNLIHELKNLIVENNLQMELNLISQYSDHIIFPSSFVYNKLDEFVKIKSNYTIKPQGLYMNIDHIPDKLHARKLILNDFLQKKIILNVASGIKRKGFDWFLEIAIKSLENKDLLFVWVGDFDNKIYNELLKKYDLKIIENLILTGYIDDNTKLLYYYDSADVLLLTSREEPFGSIVLEAFNSQTPVIAFKNAGGYLDLVIDKFTGLLCEYGDLDDMYEKIIYLLDDIRLYLSLQQNCKNAIKKYNFNDYINFLISIMEGGSI